MPLSEGDSCNFVQIGWVGARGMEAAVLGINFFPDEIKEVLNNPRIYLVGRDIHYDLDKILGPGIKGAL